MKKNLIIGIICYVITGLLTILFLATSVSVKLIMPELEKVIVLCVASIFAYFGGRFLTKYHNSKKYMKISIWVMFILYLLLLINFIVLGNNFGRNFEFIFTASKNTIKSYFDNNFNIIPFNTIKNYLDNSGIYFDIKLVCINLLGNLLCFMPFAFFLKYLFKRENKFINFLLTIILIVISFELIQLLTLSGSFDIDDIILNVGGTVLFYIIIYKSKLKSIINKIFLTYKSDKKVFKYLYYLSMIFSVIVIIYYIFLIFTNIYENKIDYQNLKCIQNNKEFIVKINNDNYYSLCKYEGFIKKGNIKYSLKEALENNFLKESDLKKLNIIKKEFITNVKIIEDNKINKISNSNYTYYLINIKDMIYHFDEKNESIYDLINTENVNDYIFSLVKISYFSNDKIMTAYSGKYFDVINCTNINEYYIVSKDYEYDEMFCKNY